MRKSWSGFTLAAIVLVLALVGGLPAGLPEAQGTPAARPATPTGPLRGWEARRPRPSLDLRRRTDSRPAMDDWCS